MVEEWSHLVVNQDKNEPPADVLIIHYTNQSIIVMYDRHHSFCYNDNMRDYAVKFIKLI